MGLQGEQSQAWSMLHLWDSLSILGTPIPPALQRPWMNVGTSYTSNIDFMYTGLLERPDAGGAAAQLRTDAVIAWGCQDAPANPDNFRFIFLRPTNQTGQAASQQGLETMRITPWGNVGIGDAFSNALQPARRLTVAQRTDNPQFRISWQENATPTLGQFTDFQSSDLGNLHIRPSSEGNRRTVAVGFLDGTLSDPINSGGVQTVLDIAGLTRIRNLQDTTVHCLITGFNVGSNINDNFLTRLDFPDDPLLFLDGSGNWSPSSGFDCRWEDITSATITGNTDIRTGFSTNSDCYRDKVVIGGAAPKFSKLEVYSIFARDKVRQAIYGKATGAGETTGAIFTAVTGETEGSSGAINSVYVGAHGSAGFLGNYGRQNVGVRGEASSGPGGTAIGVYG